MLNPAMLEPLSLQLRSTECCAVEAVAVPVSGMVSGALAALLVMVAVPLYVPAAAGAKVTCNVVLLPAFNVYGIVIPATLNPLPPAGVFDRGAGAGSGFATLMRSVVRGPPGKSGRLVGGGVGGAGGEWGG